MHFGRKKAWVTLVHREVRMWFEEEETLRRLLGPKAAYVVVCGERERGEVSSKVRDILVQLVCTGREGGSSVESPEFRNWVGRETLP